MVYFSVNYVLRTVKVVDFENKNKICDLALKISQSSCVLGRVSGMRSRC